MKIKEESIKILEEKIKNASKDYYLGEPKISDLEFDRLVDSLKELDPLNELIKQVSFGINKFMDKEELPLFIRKSLNKVHNVFEDGGLRVMDSSYVDFWVSPKVDGFSAIVKYKDGILEKAWTREGIVITEKCKYIKNLPSSIQGLEGDVFLRGELFISWNDFEFLKEDYANPRNAMAIINRKDFDNLEFISFYFHPFQRSFLNNADKINNSSYKDPFIHHSYKKLSIAFDDFHRIDSELKHRRDFYSQETQVDGLVIVNSEDFDKDDIEYRSFAYKFGTQEVETEIEFIEWNPSSRGKLIPIIHYKTVNLYGTDCSKCSGFTYDYVRENKLGKGSKIKITKANEIIPYITEVISEGNYEELLNLRNDVEIQGKHAVITGKDYYIRLRLENFIKNLIDFDGFKRSEVLLDIFQIKHFKDLLQFIENIDKDSFIEIMKSNSIMALSDDLFEKIKNCKINKKLFFNYFGIDGVGERASEKLYPCMDFIFNEVWKKDISKVEELIKNSGCNSLITKNLCDLDLLTELDIVYTWALAEERFFIEENKKFNYSVVITGSLSKTKDEYKRILQQFGVKLDSSISKTTDYLICDDVNGTSSKLKFARKNNVKIIDEEQMIKLFLN